MKNEKKLPNTRFFDVLKNKAKKSHCSYKVSAIAFDKKGDVLGVASNKHASWNVLDRNEKGRSGTAKHAERVLMSRYGSAIKTLVVCRVGRSGEIRPIDPCPTCRKVAEKLGVKVTSIESGEKTKRKTV